MKMLMLLIAACFIFCNATIAQNVGIGTATPNASAQLDISSTSKGMLVPRMTMAQRNAVVTPANGLLIYQTDNTPGFYFYNGSSWVSIAGSATLTGWSTTGNAGTTPATNFMGTTDDQPLSFKLNNINAGKWDHQKGNYFIGLNAGSAINAGVLNIGIGSNSLLNNNSGSGNTVVGHRAMNSNTSGAYNVGMGRDVLFANTGGNFNSATGDRVLYSNTMGSLNSAIGYNALYLNTVGGSNTAIGANALYTSNSGGGNTAVGKDALYLNYGGGSNTALGNAALYNNVNGLNNTAIGSYADVTNSSINKATAIGYNAKVACSKCLVLGGTATDAVKVGIGTTNPDSELDVNGFTKLGENAPKIKMKKFTGTLAAYPGSTISFPHGLNFAKILDVSIIAYNSADNRYITVNHSQAVGLQFDYYITSTEIQIENNPENSINISSAPFKAVITYEE